MTAAWYRYIDMTLQAEALYRFIDETIDTELAGELTFLANYDKTKKAIQEIVDMPDRQIDLFIRFCLQNNGRLSAQKRASHFDSLSDGEVAHMEQAVLAAYGSTTLKGLLCCWMRRVRMIASLGGHLDSFGRGMRCFGSCARVSGYGRRYEFFPAIHMGKGQG
jgi:hypothetical protein